MVDDEPDNGNSCFVVPAGCPCAVQNLQEGKQWIVWETTVETGYDRYEKCHHGMYTFRLEGWLMRIDRRFVSHLEDWYEQQQRHLKSIGRE